MGSTPMRGGVHDFNADSSNEMRDKRNFEGSGLKARAEDGISYIERNARGSLEPEQKTSGSTFRQDPVTESAGSKNGKNFTFSR